MAHHARHVKPHRTWLYFYTELDVVCTTTQTALLELLAGIEQFAQCGND